MCRYCRSPLPMSRFPEIAKLVQRADELEPGGKFPRLDVLIRQSAVLSNKRRESLQSIPLIPSPLKGEGRDSNR